MDVHVISADWATHRDDLQAIRAEVFIHEQGVPQDIEWDGQDETATHFLAIDGAGRRVGCGRLLPSGQIGRMAVRAEHRGGGIGRRILDAAVDAAKSAGFERVFLHAQSDVVDFYRRAGFLPEGPEFMEAGIPHQGMSLVLPIPFDPPDDVPRPEIREAEAETPAIGELRQHHGEGDCIEALIDVIGIASRHIRIHSPELDHTLFDREDVADALSAFVRHGPPARLTILIHSSSAIVSRGHRLLELSRRLDSKIEIRRVPAELASDNHCVLVADESAYVLLPDHAEYQALSNHHDPVQAQRLAERFDHLWERSESDPDLRTLRL